MAEAPQSHDLGTMHAAPAVEAADGVSVRPAFHRLGPFLGQVVLREPLQCADQFAVHDPCRQRVKVARGRRDPSLVEQGQAAVDLAVEDEQARLGHPTDGSGGGVTGGADLDGATCPRPGAVGVAAQHPFVAADDAKPGMHGRLTFVVLEELLGSRQPAPHRCHEGGVEQQVHGHPHRGACRGERVTHGSELRVDVLPRPDGHVEVPRPVRDVGKHRQIGDAQPTGRSCLLKEIERHLPLGSRGGVMGPGQGAVDRADLAHHTSPPTVATAVTVLLTPWSYASRHDATTRRT